MAVNRTVTDIAFIGVQAVQQLGARKHTTRLS